MWLLATAGSCDRWTWCHGHWNRAGFTGGLNVFFFFVFILPPDRHSFFKVKDNPFKALTGNKKIDLIRKMDLAPVPCNSERSISVVLLLVKPWNFSLHMAFPPQWPERGPFGFLVFKCILKHFRPMRMLWTYLESSYG